MRLVTGAALAAALLLTGCGTQADPFTASPAGEADALSMALLACTIYERPVSDNDTLGFDELSVNAQKAAATASEAAYLDPRWRTLADALLSVAEWAVI